MNQELKDQLNGKRIGAIDYGPRRTGFSVCDELHISITPKKVFNPKDDNFFNELTRILSELNVGALVVGVPYRLDEKKTDVIEEIELFIAKIKELIDIPVFIQDEAYSSIRAMETMIHIGKKKKDRRKKETKDLVASAIILRDFLNEME